MCEYCGRQAEGMAKNSGINLDPKQKEFYIQERHKMPKGNEEEGSFKPWCLCDQELLYQSLAALIEEQEAALIEEQKAALIKVFPYLIARKT